MADAPGQGVQPVQAAPHPDIDIPPGILCHAARLVVSQALGDRIFRDRRALGRRVVYAPEPAAARRNPYPPLLVAEEVTNAAFGDAARLRKDRECSSVMARDPPPAGGERPKPEPDRAAPI